MIDINFPFSIHYQSSSCLKKNVKFPKSSKQVANLKMSNEHGSRIDVLKKNAKKHTSNSGEKI